MKGRVNRSVPVRNTYLAVLIETGVIGAALFFAWLLHVVLIGFTGLRTCRLPRARLLIAACLVGLATLLVYGLFIHGLRQRNLWMIAGLIVAVPGVLKAGREVGVPVERKDSGMAGNRAARLRE